MVLSVDALFRCLGSSGMGAEINEVGGGLKCPKHSGCLIETSPGTQEREGGQQGRPGGATCGEPRRWNPFPHHLSIGDDE